MNLTTAALISIVGLAPIQLCAQNSVDTTQKVIPLRHATAKLPSKSLVYIAKENEKMIFNNQLGSFLFKYVEPHQIIVDLDGDGIISESETAHPIPPRTTFTVKTRQGDYKLQQVSTEAYVLFFSMTRLISKENPYHLKITVADQNCDGHFDTNDIIKINHTKFNARGRIIPIFGYPSRIEITPDASALVITPVLDDYVTVSGEIDDPNWTGKFYFYPDKNDTSIVTGIAVANAPAILNANAPYLYQVSMTHTKDSRIKLYINAKQPNGWQEKESKIAIKMNLKIEPTFVVEQKQNLKMLKCDVKNGSEEVNFRGLLPTLYLRKNGVDRLLSKVNYG